MLAKASADPAYTAAFSPTVLANIVSYEDNVRAVLAKVTLGEADAGIVYASDVTGDPRSQVQVIAIPDALNVTRPIPSPRSPTAPGLTLPRRSSISCLGRKARLFWKATGSRMSKRSESLTRAAAGVGVLPEVVPAPRARPVGRRRRGVLLPLLSMPMLVLLVLPLLALVLRLDLGDLLNNLTDETVVRALALSLSTATTATLLVFALGTPLAFLLARRNFRGRAVVDTLVDLPMVLPPAVAGIALLLVFGRRGWLGPGLEFLGVQIVFTPAAVVLAQLFVAGPFYIRARRPGLPRSTPSWSWRRRSMGPAASPSFATSRRRLRCPRSSAAR